MAASSCFSGVFNRDNCAMKKKFIVIIDCNPNAEYKYLAIVLQNLLEDTLLVKDSAMFKSESVTVIKRESYVHRATQTKR